MPRLLVYRRHALQRMLDWAIDFHEVHSVLDTGEVIERYPTDTPYPSRLVLGRVSGRVLHIVVADHGKQTIVITVYVPVPSEWDETFTRRRAS